MSTTLVLTLLAQFGPAILPLIQQVMSYLEKGKTTVTAEDIQHLIELGSKSSADYLRAAGVTISPDGVVTSTGPSLITPPPQPGQLTPLA